jgi:hypothetical protein
VKWFFFDRTLLEKYAVSEPQIMMMESAVKS